MSNSEVEFLTPLIEFLKPTDKLNGRKIKLIIHAGTPKTGTSSVQTYLDKRQSKLRRRGILYPHNLLAIQNPTAPKHHWFEKNLLSENFDFFLENFKNIIAQIKEDTHTVILSSEGIYNYWWDFTDQSKEVLASLQELFDVQLWVWFREPLAFIESYYKQCIRNPRVVGNPCYGMDLSFSQMLEIEWFTQHLDYQGFVDECESLFGESNVSVFNYQGDVVQELAQQLGFNTQKDNPAPRQNQSLNSASIELLKAINKYDVSASDKGLLMPHIKELNALLAKYSNDSVIDDASKKKVLSVFRPIRFISNV